MISDMYPEEKWATALSTYALGIPIGAAIGTLAGGWIGEYFGWRAAFLVVGIPGLIVAAIVYLTVKEPPRGYSDPGGVLPKKEVVPLGLLTFTACAGYWRRWPRNRIALGSL